MSWLYLLSVLAAGSCMALVDRRWRLFLFRQPTHAVVAISVGFVFFLAWDFVAIALEVYSRGESPAMTGIEVAPELPLEELFFIVFLTYVTGVLYGLFTRVLHPRESAR